MNNILFIDTEKKIHFKNENSIRKTLCGKTLSVYIQINLLSNIYKKDFSYKNNEKYFCNQCELLNNKLDYE